jgi:hypothetical protein
MNARIWVCTRDPVFDLLGLPLHPCVLLLLLYAAMHFEAKAQYDKADWARAMLRTSVRVIFGLTVVFTFAACLVRFAFQTDPSLVLNAVPYVWSLAGCLVVWFVWQRWRRGGYAPKQRDPRAVRGRGLVLCAAVLLAIRPWVSNSNIFLSAPYKIGEWLIALPTTFIASDECLASRVTEYDMVHGVSTMIGHPARAELDWRGKSAVRGVSATLYDSLDLDAIRPDYYHRHYSVFSDRESVNTVQDRASYGLGYLLKEVGRFGGAQPVLHAWKTRAPDEDLRNQAAWVLTCIRMGRQALIDRASGPGCAMPGEVCEHDKCYKIFGELCNSGAECLSDTCEGSTCCQPLGQSCNGTECCGTAICLKGQCATAESDQQTSPPAASANAPPMVPKTTPRLAPSRLRGDRGGSRPPPD